nr:hypothetical protein BaRGS_004298 [Batillaria attramentaria]
MSDQQEGHLHMGNEVNTTYNHNNPQYNIACEQLVVHSRHFYHQTVNNNNRDNPDRREQDSVADPDSRHSNTFHYIHTEDLQEAVDILEERHLVMGVRRDMFLLQPACLVEILADPLPEKVKTAMIKFHLQELQLDTPEQDALVTEILEKDVSGAAFPWCCRQMHVRTKETATEFSVTIGPSPDDHQLLMQTMYEHMWYLALRLLADRQVDERDEEGNTLLHVAADTGDLDVVKIAVKSAKVKR